MNFLLEMFFPRNEYEEIINEHSSLPENPILAGIYIDNLCVHKHVKAKAKECLRKKLWDKKTHEQIRVAAILYETSKMF